MKHTQLHNHNNHLLNSISSEDIIHCTSEGTLYGPLHSEAAVEGYDNAISEIKFQVQQSVQSLLIDNLLLNDIS